MASIEALTNSLLDETQDFYKYAKRKGQLELISELKNLITVHKRNIRCFDDAKQLAAFNKGIRVAQLEVLDILEDKLREIEISE